MYITELLIQLVRMTTCVAYTKLNKIIGINAKKTKYNYITKFAPAIRYPYDRHMAR